MNLLNSFNINGFNSFYNITDNIKIHINTYAKFNTIY